MDAVHRSMIEITRVRLARLDEAHARAKTPEKRKAIEATVREVKRDLEKFEALSKKLDDAENALRTRLITELIAFEGPLTRREKTFLEVHGAFAIRVRTMPTPEKKKRKRS